jgi:uncharacterized membrane protein YheB (UPF0754 family)
MLFKPYRKYHFAKIRVPFTPGIIPRQRKKISQGIGQIVSQKLLNADTLRGAVRSKDLKNGIILWLRTRINKILNYKFSTIGEVLKRAFKSDFDYYYNLIFKKIRSFISNVFKNPKNQEILTTLLDKVLDAFFEKSVDEVIGTDVIQASIAKITSDTLQKDGLQDKIFVLVQDFFNEIFKSDKKIREIMPESLTDIISKYIKSRLPGLLVNVSTWLDDPRVKGVIQEKMLQVLTDYISSLNFIQSVVVELLGVEEKVAEKIPYFVDRLGSEIAEMSNDYVFVNYLEDKVDLFLGHFLDKRMSDLTEETGIPLRKLLIFFRDIFQGIIKDPEKIRAFLQEMTAGFNLEKKKLSSFINKEEQDTIKKRIVKNIIYYFSSEDGLEQVMNFLKGRINDFIFKKEIGSLQNILKVKKTTVMDISKRIMNYVVILIDRELPLMLDTLNLEALVKERIDSFPLEEVEDIILKIIHDQLKWINVFGAILGFLIGCIQLIIR